MKRAISSDTIRPARQWIYQQYAYQKHALTCTRAGACAAGMKLLKQAAIPSMHCQKS